MVARNVQLYTALIAAATLTSNVMPTYDHTTHNRNTQPSLSTSQQSAIFFKQKRKEKGIYLKRVEAIFLNNIFLYQNYIRLVIRLTEGHYIMVSGIHKADDTANSYSYWLKIFN